MATLPVLNALFWPSVSLSICAWFGAAPEAIRSWYHCQEASQFSGIWARAVVGDERAGTEERADGPGVIVELVVEAPLHDVVGVERRVGGVVAVGVDGEDRASSGTLSMSHGSPSAYGSPYSWGGYSRPASSKSSLL